MLLPHTGDDTLLSLRSAASKLLDTLESQGKKLPESGEGAVIVLCCGVATDCCCGMHAFHMAHKVLVGMSEP